MPRVAVVGAGTGGLAASLAAVQRGASVALFEPGGSLPPPKSSWPSLLEGDDRRLPSPNERLISSAGIKLELNQRVSKIGNDMTVHTEGRRPSFEAVVLCTGSSAVPESLEGTRKRGVHALNSRAAFSELGERLGGYSKAVVFGSGPVAVEVAERLRSRRVAVSLLAPGGLLPVLNDGPRGVLLRGLSAWGVEVSNTKPEKVVGVDRVEAVVAGGDVVPCDSFIIVQRFSPTVPSVPAVLGRSGGLVVDGAMRSSSPSLYGAGDCTEIPSGRTTVSVMFESSAKLMGTVAGSNAAGAAISTKVVGSFFKELFGVGVAVAGLGLAEAAGLGLEVSEASRTWGGELSCSIVFERATKALVGAQLVGRGVAQYAESLPLMVASAARLHQVAYQETMVSTDISPVAETAREGLREQ